jgi:hypothetical protein
VLYSPDGVGGPSIVAHQAVVPSQLPQCELKHQLAGALRPSSRSLNLSQPLFKATHNDQ